LQILKRVKITAFLMAVSMALANFPVLQAFGAESNPTAPTEEIKPTETVSAEETNGLPASYDLRDYGLLTSIKNQGDTNTCWAHAAMASAESNMLKTGLANEILEKTELDLSESHLAWFGRCQWSEDTSDPFYHKGFHDGVEGYSGTYNDLAALGTLAAWKGVQLEKNFPSITTKPQLDEAFRYTSYAHLQNATFFGIKRNTDKATYCETIDRNSIKQCLMDNGAMSLSYYHVNSCSSANNFAYYCPEKQADSNHSVTLIGWDDNYPKENFATQPPENGAWLCKNSWGEEFGNGGYFYLSYSDPNVQRFISFQMESAGNYDSIYQIDSDQSLNSASGNYLHGYVAGNVFTAKKNENITAVSFGSWFNDIPYSVSIYQNVDTSKSDPTNGTLLYKQDGVFPLAGYHTVKLKRPVSVPEGASFSVVVTIKKVDNNWICRDKSGEQTNSFCGLYDVESKSYSNWENAKDGCFCIKAFTNDTISSANPYTNSGAGDVDEDGNVDILDVLKLNQYLMGTGTLSSQGVLNADVNGDGVVQDSDVLDILKYLMNVTSQIIIPQK